MSQPISGNTTTSISTNTINDSCKQSISKCAIVVIATAVAVVAIIVILATASALVSAIACPLIFVAVLITAILLLTSKNATFVAQSRFPRPPVLVHRPRFPAVYPLPILTPPPCVRRQHPGDTLGHRAFHGMAAGTRSDNTGAHHPLAPMAAVPNGTNIPANQVGNRFGNPMAARPGSVFPAGVVNPAARAVMGTPFAAGRPLAGTPAAAAHNHHGAAGSSANPSAHHGPSRPTSR